MGYASASSNQQAMVNTQLSFIGCCHYYRKPRYTPQVTCLPISLSLKFSAHHVLLPLTWPPAERPDTNFTITCSYLSTQVFLPLTCPPQCSCHSLRSRFNLLPSVCNMINPVLQNPSRVGRWNVLTEVNKWLNETNPHLLLVNATEEFLRGIRPKHF